MDSMEVFTAIALEMMANDAAKGNGTTTQNLLHKFCNWNKGKNIQKLSLKFRLN